jgi:hypothetical protein
MTDRSCRSALDGWRSRGGCTPALRGDECGALALVSIDGPINTFPSRSMCTRRWPILSKLSNSALAAVATASGTGVEDEYDDDDDCDARAVDGSPSWLSHAFAAPAVSVRGGFSGRMSIDVQ